MKSLEHTIRNIHEGRGHDAVQQFASSAHDEWRKGFDPEGSGKERIKKNSDGSEGNINVPFNKLHPDWQKENLEAGKAALVAIRKHPKDMEKASEHVHNEWMKRNPKADWNASQHVPYSELPETEKEKDRVHVRKMSAILGKSIQENKTNPEHTIRNIILESLGATTTDKFKGSQFADASSKTTTPKIGPGHNEGAEKAANARNAQKTKTSETMHNGKVEEGALDTADSAAELVVPYYSAGKKAYKGDWAGAAKDAAIDTGLLALTGGVGKLAGAALRGGSKIIGGAGKAAVGGAEKITGKLATGVAGKAAVAGAEKAAEKTAAETGIKAAEKGAVETGEKAAEKEVAKTGEKAAVEAGEKAAGSSLIKSLGRGAMLAAALRKNSALPNPEKQHYGAHSEKQHVHVNTARAHRVHEASEGTEKRMKEPNVGRPDTAPSKRLLRKQGEIRTKFIDEAAKKNSRVIKKIVDDKRRAVMQGQTINDRNSPVIINPPIYQPDPEDYKI